MKTPLFKYLTLAVILLSPSVYAATSITQYGITWGFDKDYPSGQFCTGDYWVVGPVQVIGITTDLHASGFTPKAGEDGSMVNPGTDSKQGYDNRLPSYEASLNAALINGQPISPNNPLPLQVNSSLVSMVSWLFHSFTDAEPGTPKFNPADKAPRPCTRTGAVLTVLSAVPPKGSFRPPYVGTDKTLRFSADKLDFSKLKNFPPVAATPSPATLEKAMERPWIDHVYEYLGSMVHPSENMPDYGQQMAWIMESSALLLHMDFSQLPGHPTKNKLLISLVQYGIDLTGIADNGGGWPNNGGHLTGRKLPILFAGIILNDPHMKEVGKWKTRFHEDEQTFYVSQAEVDMTHSPEWRPDKRIGVPAPYETADIGMPEWGICHSDAPRMDNRTWNTVYRDINGAVNPGYVLAARIMDQEEAWNHKALFDYTDRSMKLTGGRDGVIDAPVFVINMWNMFEANRTQNASSVKK